MVEEIVNAAAMCLIEQPAELQDAFQMSLVMGYMLLLKRKDPGVASAEQRRRAEEFLHRVKTVAKGRKP
jgi:hypothetical protein